MKKILIAMVLFVFVALPMSVMAMSTLADNDLSTVTGQAGVSIGADITMNVSFGAIAWGDIDGLASVGTSNPLRDAGSVDGGWVGINNLNIQNLRIHMRTDLGMRDQLVAESLGGSMLTYTPGTGGFEADLAGSNGATQETIATASAFLSTLATEQLMTIDVYTSGGTTGYDGKTFVRIGLPTFEITMNDLAVDMGLWTNVHNATLNTDTPGTYQSLGKVYLTNLQVLLDKNNFVDIGTTTAYGSNTTGVLIHVGNQASPDPYSNPDGYLLHLNLDALAWGDADGLSTGLTSGYGGDYTTGAGYVGLKGLNIAMAMDMYIDINVGTATGGGVVDLVTELATIHNMGTFNAVKAGLLASLRANNNILKDDVATILHEAGVISRTSVDIALHGTINIPTIATQAVLANNSALQGVYWANGGSSATGETGQVAGLLGNLYIKDLHVEIVGGVATPAVQSWVSISAH